MASPTPSDSGLSGDKSKKYDRQLRYEISPGDLPNSSTDQSHTQVQFIDASHQN